MARRKLREQFSASTSKSSLLVFFIPSVDRDRKPVDQDRWVQLALEVLGRLFGGATAFPRAKGVWRDDDQAGELIFDDPVVIQCYTSDQAIEDHAEPLRTFLVKMGEQTNQGAVGFVIDRDYLEIQFPLKS